LRAFTQPPERRQRKPAGRRSFRSRRAAPPAAEGRWSLIENRAGGQATPTEWSTATAQQLLARYGVLTREVAGAEGIAGGFGAVYEVLKAMEDAGRVRRGYFVGAVGATQFAVPAALELMRSLATLPDEAETVVLAATDPANPFGTMLKWPAPTDANGSGGRGPTRTVGSLVVLVNGSLAAYISRGGRQLLVYLPEDEPARSVVGRALATRLAQFARPEGGGAGLLVAEINGIPAADHPFASFLIDAGFSPSAMGFQLRRHPVSSMRAEPPIAGRAGRHA
jgi:ATP-dependent helicase Lhr and Lhr-like helicase